MDSGVNQRNIEQDWKVVSDVLIEEGCSLCLAQENSGCCDLISAQPHKCCVASREPVSLSGLRSVSGEGHQLGLAGLGCSLSLGLEGSTCLLLAGTWLSQLVRLPWALLTPAGLTPQ